MRMLSVHWQKRGLRNIYLIMYVVKIKICINLLYVMLYYIYTKN